MSQLRVSLRRHTPISMLRCVRVYRCRRLLSHCYCWAASLRRRSHRHTRACMSGYRPPVHMHPRLARSSLSRLAALSCSRYWLLVQMHPWLCHRLSIRRARRACSVHLDAVLHRLWRWKFLGLRVKCLAIYWPRLRPRGRKPSSARKASGLRPSREKRPRKLKPLREKRLNA